MKTSELIESLTLRTQPVQRLKKPYMRGLIWFLCSIFWSAVCIILLRVNPNIAQDAQSLDFILDTLFALTLCLVSSALAFEMSVPGATKLKLVRQAIAVPIALWLLGMATKWMYEPGHYFAHGLNPGPGIRCLACVVLVSIVPTFLLFRMIRKAAPLDPLRTGAIAMVAVGSLGAFAAQWICRREYVWPFHFIVWHLAPSVALVALGIWLGAKFLKWNPFGK